MDTGKEARVVTRVEVVVTRAPVDVVELAAAAGEPEVAAEVGIDCIFTRSNSYSFIVCKFSYYYIEQTVL